MAQNDLKRTRLTRWRLQSADKIEGGRAEISAPEFDSNGWYDAEVPTTVLGALIASGEYPNPYFGTNLKDIPPERFERPWWFRTQCDLADIESLPTTLLEFDGINYSANVFLNGRKLADAGEVRGAFRRFRFDISGFAREGPNALAVEVIPPKPGDFSTGFVDWNPPPPDRNMGVFRPVTLRRCNNVSIENPFVQTQLDLPTLSRAQLTVTAELANHTDSSVTGILTGRIESRTFGKTVTLDAGERQIAKFTPEQFSALRINQPRLWWPHDLGEPELYDLDLEFTADGHICDIGSITFGIRRIEDYFNEQGHRGFRINGRNVLVRAGGWTDDLLLADTPEKLESQIRYVKHMNLSAIRLEGIWGKDHTLYDLCDKYGVLMMVGWNCHWEHEQYLGKPVHERFGGITTPEDIDLIARSWADQVLWLRNHPSIFVWTVGSDKVPHPDLERRYVKAFQHHDPTRPYLASTGGVGSEQAIIGSDPVVSDISGPTGVKMLGPYAYTPPVYWYEDTTRGGAYGFNTETGPGAAPPVLETLKSMIPKDHVWPIDEVWDFHCGLNEFANLDRYRTALEKRYGRADTLEAFAYKAQIMNYELIRPMFEAFRARKGPATGVVQWMLNAAWPKLYWQLYDWCLMPTGALYGAKKACEPLQLVYDYANHSIFLVNDTLDQCDHLTVRVRIFDAHSQQVFDGKRTVDAEPLSSQEILTLPQLDGVDSLYFLTLTLADPSGCELASNFYWLGTTSDVLDYDAKVEPWEYYTPSRQFADFTPLNSLPVATLEISHELESNRSDDKLTVTLANTSNTVAFGVELKLLNADTAQPIVPVFWTDNYLALLPHQHKTISATFKRCADRLTLAVQAWNMEKVQLAVDS